MEKIGKSRVQSLSLAVVWKELQVLSRLLYRAKNQHRRDRMFQKLLRISKELKRYQVVDVGGFLKQELKAFKRVGGVISEAKVTPLIAKLLECVQFTARLLELSEETFSELHGRLKMSLFIPFNLLMCACLSRIWVAMGVHLWALSQVYSAVRVTLPTDAQFPASAVECLHKQHKHYLTVLGAGTVQPHQVPSEAQNESGDVGVPVALSAHQEELRHCGTPSTAAPAKRRQKLCAKAASVKQEKFVVVKMNVGKKVRRVKVSDAKVISKLLKDKNVKIVASGGMKKKAKQKKTKKSILPPASDRSCHGAPNMESDVHSLQRTFEQDMLKAEGETTSSLSDIDSIFKVLEES